MKPSIGRIVHYQNANGHRQAAIITAVHSDTTVSLSCFVYGDNTLNPISTVEQGDKVGQWQWPEKV